MKQRFLLLAYGFAGWTLLFVLGRALFLLYHFDQSSALSATDWILVFVYGLRMDFAMAGYMSLLPGLLFALLFPVRGRHLWPFWFGYHGVVIPLTVFIMVVDFELYNHWGFRLDATPLLYLGKEAAGSGDLLRSVLLVLYWLALCAGALYAFHRFFKNRILSLPAAGLVAAPVMVVITAALIIPIRGSFGVAPMNTGFVYFHKTNMFANHAAVNVVWNFGYAVQKMRKLRYPENYLDKAQCEDQFRKLMPPPGATTRLIRARQPNILIVILESFTYRFVEPLGGLPGITPRFNELIREGILFDNFYSSGDRTDKGIVSILNGYPAQPLTSIIKDPKKTRGLPYLNKIFKGAGYTTGFTYGYNINYANFRSYLINAEFDHTTHSEDFPPELNTSKWGVHDHYVFDRFFEECNAVKEPFFKVIMTQSSHEPFDVPMETVIAGEDNVHRFLNSAYYTDSTFGRFIDRAKAAPWWDSTLVVVTADHGHMLPDNEGLTNPRRFRIPMLWLGGALTVTDTVIHTVGGHTDIPNTVLGQVGVRTGLFPFGQDMLNSEHRPFAIYIFNNGFGWVQPDGVAVYDNVLGKPVQVHDGHTGMDLLPARAYVQKLYSDFNSR
jgi:phosphoglycerol transferase MdoB-like AlkP superfamily enzyme